MKILLAYYSSSGRTENAVNGIVREFGTSLVEALPIVEVHPRRLDLDSPPLKIATASLAARLGLRPRIEKPRVEALDYDLVVLAGPVWAGRPAPALLSFIDAVPLLACPVAILLLMRENDGGAGDWLKARLLAQGAEWKASASLLASDCEVPGSPIVAERFSILAGLDLAEGDLLPLAEGD